MINSVLQPTLLWMARTQQQVDHVLCTSLKQRAHCAGGRKTLSSREPVILSWICWSRDSTFADPSWAELPPLPQRLQQKGSFQSLWKPYPHPAELFERDSLSISFTSLPLKKTPTLHEPMQKSLPRPGSHRIPTLEAKPAEGPDLPSAALSSACLFLSLVPVSAELAQVLPGLF